VGDKSVLMGIKMFFKYTEMLR